MTAGSVSSDRLARRAPETETKDSAPPSPQKSPPRTVSAPPDVEEDSDGELIPIRKRPRSPIPRVLSQDSQYISSAGEDDDDSDVPDMDIKASTFDERDLGKVAPPLRNPLSDANLLSAQLRSLQLESELFPLRQLIARLMTNPQHNRRGLFNIPVDVKGLGLEDYRSIIDTPMDLGTVKARLHAVAYNSRDECAQDVRLVFENAMKFNPPDNVVHISACALLNLFNEQYEIMQATNVATNVVPSNPAPMKTEFDPIQVPASLPPRRRNASMKTPSLDGPSSETVSGVVSASTSTINLPTTDVCTTNTPLPSLYQAPEGTVQATETTLPVGQTPPTVAMASTNPSKLNGKCDTNAIPKPVDNEPHSSAVPPNPASLAIIENQLCPSLIASRIASHCSTIRSVSTDTCPSINSDETQPLTGIAVYSEQSERNTSLHGSSAIANSHHWVDPDPQGTQKALKRAMNIAAKHAKHTCRSCLGRTCVMCNQGCLSHEPALLICTGANCSGAKIRKGAIYYIAKDGSRQFCQRCFSNLQAVLPHTSDQFESMGTAVRYKRDLLKRKNDEEVAEHWLTCKRCRMGVHKICAMFNEFTDSESDFTCPSCYHIDNAPFERESTQPSKKMKHSELYTFVSGTDIPAKISDVVGSHENIPHSSENLPETKISSFIEEKVRHRMRLPEYPNADKTVIVRMISDCSKAFKVPEVVRKHFRMHAEVENTKHGVPPPSSVHYNSKAIMLFQKMDGLDVCIFCMYVQEYDGDDDYDEGSVRGMQQKRVYIAYLDSVEHFRPRACRTAVYHEILVAYLATARARGYETVHIWACPPSRGNSFVFWNHPASQRTPNKDRLVSWYHGVLSRAVEAGIVTDVKSLFESSFHDFMKSQGSETDDEEQKKHSPKVQQEGVLGGLLICPPLLDGDFWIEEAVRVHAASISRFLKSKSTGKEGLSAAIIKDQKRCPALQVAALLRDKVMTRKAAVPFQKPVNAAALKLKDYHKVISNPMDLGTVYARCLLGEFEKLKDVVSDVELVFHNAMKYNPKGHSVHDLAVEMREFFIGELNQLTKSWKINRSPEHRVDEHSWVCVMDTGMSLDIRMDADLLSCIPSDNITMQQEGNLIVDGSVVIAPNDVMNATDVSSSVVSPTKTTQTLPSNHEFRSDFKLRVNVPLKSIPGMGFTRSPLSSPSSVRSNLLLENKLEFLTGGSVAIHQRMVGEDVWLLDKRNVNSPKCLLNSKKNGKRKKSAAEIAMDELPQKRRRQSWLGQEVGLSVRRLRTSFFTCSLSPRACPNEQEDYKASQFDAYVASFHSRSESSSPGVISHLADARHALLEFSQFRNLEFDTLRRAKFSTFILLYHLHHDDAPGLIPTCTTCQEAIEDVRWHRVRRVAERHHSGRIPPTLRAQRIAEIAIPEEIAEASHWGEELCSACFSQQTKAEDFIPLPVSFKA